MSLQDTSYRNFRFRVKWRGRYVAGFSGISPLPLSLKTAGHRLSGQPPPAIGPEGQGTPFFISLNQGTSFDLGFEQWVSMVRSFGPATGKGSLLPEYKTMLTIEITNENGEQKESYQLTHCRVTEYRAVPSPDAGSHETAIELLRLGFDRSEPVLPADT